MLADAVQSSVVDGDIGEAQFEGSLFGFLNHVLTKAASAPAWVDHEPAEFAMGCGACAYANHGDDEVVEGCDEEVATVCSVAGFNVEEFKVPGFGCDASGAFSD